MREKIHYLKFCMSCSAGQAGHLASPLIIYLIQCHWEEFKRQNKLMKNSTTDNETLQFDGYLSNTIISLP